MNRSDQGVSRLPETIAEHLWRFVRRRRWLAVLRAGGQATLLALSWLLLWGLTDRLMALAAAERLVLLVILLLGISLVLGPPIRRLLLPRRHTDWLAAAQEIERRDRRFNESLATVVSQMLAGDPAATGASAQLVRQLCAEVQQHIREDGDVRQLAPARPLLRVWASAGAAAVLLVLLCPIRQLDLPRLIARQLLPMAEIAPATTTRLSVQPGSCDVVEGKPLTVRVSASRLPTGTVLLRTSSDGGKTWTSLGMSAVRDVAADLPDAATAVFEYTIPAIWRDLTYQVHGGDATAGPFLLRVLRRPIVREFRIVLTYPDYVAGQPLTLTSPTGQIEAPAGTLASITVVASEPLKDAWFTIDGRRMASSPTSDPVARQVRFRIVRDTSYEVELLSDRGVLGGVSQAISIRAIPDHPPIARLLPPDALSLLRPRDIVRLNYQAADDYGLAGLEARIQVNRLPAAVRPLQIGQDPRRCDETFELDLAEYHVSIGDVMTITLAATDRAGQVTVSNSYQVLIAPLAVDPQQRRAIVELGEAGQLAEAVSAAVSSAGELVVLPAGQAEKPGPEATRRLSRRLSQAAESATLLVRAILRATVGASAADHALVLESLADEAQVQASSLDQLCIDVAGAADEQEFAQIRSAVAQAGQRAGKLADDLQSLWRGLAAEAMLGTHRALAVLEHRARHSPELLDSQLLSAMTGRMRQQMREQADAVHVPADAADLELLLRARMLGARQVAESRRPVEFVQAARQWAASVHPPRQHLPERLATASQAQAVRRDANLLLARDLQLASRAARTIDALVGAGHSSGAEANPAAGTARLAYVSALAAILREHEMHEPDRERDGGAVDEQTGAQIRAAAERARQAMRAWAGESGEFAAEIGADSWQAPLRAMDAAALTGQRRYDEAAAIDAQLFADSPRTRHRIQREVQKARQIDQLTAEQQRLQHDQEPGGFVEQAFAAPGQGQQEQQRELAARIEQLRDVGGRTTGQLLSESTSGGALGAAPPAGGDSRSQALALVRQAQQLLAALPQRLGRVEQIADWAGQTQSRASQVWRQAERVAMEQRAAAQRAAAAAQEQANEAWYWLDDAGRAVDDEALAQLGRQLSAFAPETSSAVEPIEQQLNPALLRVRDAIDARDVEAVYRATAEARRATAAVQDGLRAARQSLLERDPLVAARWFAEEAALALDAQAQPLRSGPAGTTMPATQSGADQKAEAPGSQAKQAQASVLEALARAWDDSIHRAAAARLAGLDSMASIFRWYGVSGEQRSAAVQGIAAATAREWSRLRQWRGEDLVADVREPDPPGYQQALRAYFQALGQAAESSVPGTAAPER